MIYRKLGMGETQDWRILRSVLFGVMKSSTHDATPLESKIYLIRGQKVMLDFGLAELYEIPTGQLNQQVKRNAYRFPSGFMFFPTNQELTNLKSQFVISSSTWGGRRHQPET